MADTTLPGKTIFKAFRRTEVRLFAVLCGVVGILSLLPLARLMWEAILPQGRFSTLAAREIFNSSSTWVALGHSLEVAVGGTLLASVLGIVVALAVSMTDLRARSLFVLCFVLPVMIAPQVMALSWLQIVGPASPLLKMLGIAPPIGTPNPLYSKWGIILLLGVHYAPLVFLAMRAGLRALPRELIEAGLSNGAGSLTVLRTIVLPLTRPALVAGVALVFVSCIGNFGIPAFLGIPGRYLVLPTLIYQKLAGAGPSILSEVAVLSMLIGIIAIGGIALQNFALRGKDYAVVAASIAARPVKLGRWRTLIEGALWFYVLFVLVVPIFGLVLNALAPAYGVIINFNTATWENFAYVLFEHDAVKRAFANSMLLSLGASVILLILSIPLAYFLVWRKSRALRALNLLIELPYALPGVVLAIAAILLFLKPIPVFQITLYNTVWIILFAYLARFLALAIRPTISGYLQVDRALDEAAQVAGANILMRLRTILFPLVAPTAVTGALLVFLTAFNELTVSALLWSSGAETLGVLVFSFEQAGSTNIASAVAVLTIIVTVLLMLSTLLFASRLPEGVIPWRD
ncbi:Ferric iron ABC transporter, permease protein [hydrothermal vent metagenome]|uniref:Ferric iron ABC transporter, permease protein n=1 Tax=hydrothermal vent metagenome TaxID=652676 RepID=A0A3B0TVU3_9ZZZZ